MGGPKDSRNTSAHLPLGPDRIHCTLDKPVSEMKDVIAQNAPGVYKFRAKVIDFYPKQMMDWIVAYCDSCEEGKQ